MPKLIRKDLRFITKGGKLVKASDPANCPCCGDGPCPPGKYCTWIPPDPCSTGKCQPDRIDDNPFLESQCGDAPYDCRSEEACNQWYEQNPNPLCPCWVCENGELVDRPAYTADCTGFPGAKPEGVECPPPEPLGWFCDTDKCKPCYSKEAVAVNPDLSECPPDATLHDSEQECKDAGCPLVPPIVSCGENVPKTASVSLCGIIDRLNTAPPACMGGQPGFAAPFNQTVELKLTEPVDTTVGTVWTGELSLPDGYYGHKLTLTRGNETNGLTCDGAALVLQGTPSSFGCASARWVRNYDNPLNGFSTWKFGSRFADTQLRIQTMSGGIQWDGVSNCTITFGGAKAENQENPLP